MKRAWEPDELVAEWTLGADDLGLLTNKTGATRLGFIMWTAMRGGRGKLVLEHMS
jgi:hypothetical protein